jgi:hypothetical protein
VFFPAPGGFLDTQELTQRGTYRVVFDPPEDETGSITTVLHGIPPDPAVSIKVDGQSERVANTVPGQNMRVEVSGEPGPITLHVGGLTLPDGLLVQAVDQKGIPVGEPAPVPAEGGDVRLTIVGSGVIVVLDPDGDQVGRATVSATTA